MYPGSFNPLHEGHQQLALVAQQTMARHDARQASALDVDALARSEQSSSGGGGPSDRVAEDGVAHPPPPPVAEEELALPPLVFEISAGNADKPSLSVEQVGE